MLPRSGHLPGAHYADWLRSLQSQLDQRRAGHLLRELHPSNVAPGSTICLDGREYLQFCSNNYLGLAPDPRLIEAAREATSRFGTGSGASRLVAGSLEIHQRLEAALARLKNCEAALLFPSGYMANLAALSTFASPQDTIVSDKLNHASLLDAAQHAGAMHRTFPHRRYARAAELLARAPVGRRFLVTDALFSMDGDVADHPLACTLANQLASRPYGR